MESGILLVGSIYSCIAVVIAGSILRNYSVDSCAYVAGQRNRFLEIPAVSGKVFLPDDNSIFCGGSCDPLSINCSCLSQRIAKCKLIAVCAVSICIPSAEGVTKPGHFTISTRFSCNFILLYELRSVICAAFTVFVKHKPTSGRFIYRKRNVSSYSDRVFILVQVAFFIAIYVILSFLYQPSLKIVFGICRSISHIYSICALCLITGYFYCICAL